MKLILKFLFFIYIGIISTNTYCQSENLILGTWIKTTIESSNKEINENTGYLKYTFKPNGKLYVSTSSQELDIESDYKIIGNLLELNYNKPTILKLENDSLIIQDSNNKGETTTIHFTKKEVFIKNNITQKDYFLKGKDTIYLESDFILPTFQNNRYKSAGDFFMHHIKDNINDEEEYSFVTFIIDTDGQVSDIKIFHHINQKYDQNAKAAIEKSTGMWIPPSVNGKKVKVLKMHTIHYYKMPDVDGINGKNGEITMISSTPEKFNKRYLLFYKEAVKQFLNNNYKSALNLFIRCEKLTPNRLNSKIQMGNCYKALNEIEKFTNIKESISKSKLGYVSTK